MFFWLYLDQTKTFNYDANINPSKEKSKIILNPNISKIKKEHALMLSYSWNTWNSLAIHTH